MADLGFQVPPVQVVGGKEAKSIKDRLAKEHGIMVRHYAKPGECLHQRVC
jgi:hypothetical protein